MRAPIDRASRFRLVGAVLTLAAGLGVLLCVPAFGEQDAGAVFGSALRAPNLAAAAFEQELPPTPDLCPFPPKDTTFSQLGRHAGPPAVAYHSAGRSTAVAGPAPYPELFPTGQYAFEPNIGVTSNGTVLVDGGTCDQAVHSQLASMVLRSTDGGASFKDVSPNVMGAPTHPITADPYLYVDKATDRVFTADIENVGGCEPFSFSNDAGASWTNGAGACTLTDHQNIFTGPPPAGGAQPSGYPDVVYYCAIDAGEGAGFSKATACLKSLDGGMTFLRTGAPAYLCDPQVVAASPVGCDGGTGPGFVDTKGTVYLPRGFPAGSAGQQPFLAISHDEGASWGLVQVAHNGLGTQNDAATDGLTLSNHEAGVAVDRQGNIYYTWVAHDRLPYLTVSHDGGKTWSAPAMYGPPGVAQAWNPAIDVGPSGRIAFAYMASTNAPRGPFADGPEDEGTPYKDATFNGYITISDNPSASDPTYYTASVNAPSYPFVRGACAQVRCAQEVDFIDTAVARDGTPWAIFVDACSAAKSCISPQVGAGVVARLVTSDVAATSARFGAGPPRAGGTKGSSRACASAGQRARSAAGPAARPLACHAHPKRRGRKHHKL